MIVQFPTATLQEGAKWRAPPNGGKLPPLLKSTASSIGKKNKRKKKPKEDMKSPTTDGDPTPPKLGHSATTAAADHLSITARRDVTYSCGHCGYELNLSSCNRNTADMGSGYGKAIKRGLMPFFSIDESRFTRRDVVSCRPYFSSRSVWGLIRRRTKLLCRGCGNYIGHARDGDDDMSGNLDYMSGNGTGSKVYSIRIRALRPSVDSGFGGVLLDP